MMNKGNDEMDEESMQYLKMFLSNAKIKTTYHLPGKVKKSTIPNAVIDGKIVKVENSFLDILEQKVKVDGYIKYKRR